MAEVSDSRDDQALALAYRHIARRERTRAELRSHLQARGIDEALASRTVTVLCEHGYLDDVRFARLFVQDKRELEGWGSERIARTLRQRGIEDELIASALVQSESGPAHPDTSADPHRDELERALAVLRHRVPEPPQDRRAAERALGLLLRRGYETDLALQAVRLHARGTSPDDL